MTTHELLESIGHRFIELLASTHPVAGTLLGLHDRDGDLGTYTDESVAAYASALRALRRGVEDTAPASQADRIDRRFLLHLLDSELLEAEDTRWWQRNPDQAVDLALTGLFFLMQREFAPAHERAASLAGRLGELPAYLARSRATLTDTPRVLTETAIQSAEGGVGLIEDEIPAWVEPLGAAGRAVREAAGPAAEALREHAAWLRDDYLARSTAPTAVGAELLSRIVAAHHLLPDAPDEIALRGEDMLRRIGEEISAVAGSLGFPDWRSAVAETKKDVPSPDALVDAYAEAMRWTEQVVRDRRLATPASDAPLDVMATPLFWRHTMPFAAYTVPGAFEEDQRGIFWVTPPDGNLEALKDHARAAIPVVALHEGYPGHHLQLTRANRHPSRVRRLGDSPLLIEGWAFYCEELGHEQGLLSPQSRLCQLKDELWRACRVVIDMRLHQGTMTVEEAVDMLVREADVERPNAEAEVRRYAFTPGYQMSYAIGKEEILRLRREVKRREGPKFSLTEFHDRVLNEGSMPVPLVAQALLGLPGDGPERASRG